MNAPTLHSVEPHRAAPAAPPPPAKTPLIFIGVAAIVLAVLAFVTFRARSRDRAVLETETKENAIPSVTVVRPKRTAAQVEIELPGNVQAFEDSPIYSRVNGYLKSWLTDIGSRVEPGQVLAEIDTPELDQELNQAQAAEAQAQANLEIAKITANRWQNLRKSDSVSQQDSDERTAAWHAREADVNAAHANVNRLMELTHFKQLRAPFAGIVTVRNVDVGTLVTGGSGHEIFRVEKIDPLRVYISLPQAYSQLVQPGDDATLAYSELPGQKFTGKVVRTAGAIDQVSRTLLTEVQVPNHDGKLFPGSHTMVKLKLVGAVDPVVVPVNTLLFRNDKGMQVGVVSNGVVRLVSVTVGRDYGTSVEIVHGLSETDDVIVNPVDSLEPDTHVRVAAPPTTAKKK